MKKLFYLLLTALIIASCTTEKKELLYTLKINVDTVVDGYAYLQKRVGGDWVKLDSTTMEDGVFAMQGVVKFPDMQYIFIKDIRRNVPLFIDGGDIVVNVFKDDYGATTITGSPAQTEYQAFLDETGVYDDRMRAYYKD